MDGINYDLIIITGPTASGKTAVAAGLANKLDGEVISADSRQVYRGMDIGSGKDYSDYSVDGRDVPYHLIDIVDPGYKYNVYEYQHDFLKAYNDIGNRAKVPVVCGGSGMYIDSIVSGYTLLKVPPDMGLRKKLEKLSLPELKEKLKSYRVLHNTSDIDNTKRAIRAIEIEEYYKNSAGGEVSFPELKSLIVGIKYDRDSRRRRITERLKARLDEGMIDEVRSLMESGLSAESLIYYGLEYKFVTLYLIGSMEYKEMFERLQTAIHQFSKRQMTWFRGMERKGIKIHWLDGYLPKDEKLNRILKMAKL